MRIFKNKPFSRFARKNGITDEDLCEAVRRLEEGIVDADLGGGVIKQRVARPNEGRSSGFRTIILVCIEERAFFVHGFSKNQRDNIRTDELKGFKELAALFDNYSESQIQEAVTSGTLIEVRCNEQDIPE